MYTKHQLSLLLLIITSCLSISACNTLQRIQASELTGKFEQTFRQYSKHLRWGHFREMTAYLAPEQIPLALKKIPSLRKTKVSSVKPTGWVLDKEAGSMTGNVVINYYIPERNVVREITQHQTWHFDNEVWLLDNGLPDLR